MESRKAASVAFSCANCRRMHKKCSSEATGCQRCVSRGVPCVYPSSSTSSNTSSAGSGASNGRLTAKVLTSAASTDALALPSGAEPVWDPSRYTSSTSTSTVTVQSQTAEHQLADPDLNATMEDWAIVYRHLSGKGAYSILSIINVQRFLRSFFFEPPALRLAWCTVAATIQKMPHDVCQNYYRRAMKALWKSLNEPCIKSVEAMLLLSGMDLANGRPEDGRFFFETAVRITFEQKLYIDPDDSPWLDHLNLSDDEKDERRRIFWMTYYSLKVLQIASAAPIPVQMDTCNVKVVRKCGDQDVIAVCFLAGILDVIHEIKLHQSMEPTSVPSILSCCTCDSIRPHLNLVRAQIPANLILSTPEEVDQFIITSAASSDDFVSITLDALSVSLVYNSALCLLTRPTMYLTAFLALDSPILINNPSFISKLLVILTENLTAALTIAQINTHSIHFSPSTDLLHDGSLAKKLWVENAFACFNLFEAAICIWFMTCKTRPFWWNSDAEEQNDHVQSPSTPTSLDPKPQNVLRMSLADRKRNRSLVLDILRTLRETSVVFPMISPLSTCVAEMAQEMKQVEEEIAAMCPAQIAATAFQKNHWRVFKVKDRGIDSITVGLKVMSLDSEARLEEGQEPWAYLGLLGVEVGEKGMRFNAHYEEAWRRFWQECDGIRT